MAERAKSSADTRRIVFEAVPEELPLPPQSLDHCDHVVRISLAGHPELAADHLLSREMNGKLVETVGSVIRQLNLEFLKSSVTSLDKPEDRRSKMVARQRAYQLLAEIALNLAGIERKKAGFSDRESDETFARVVRTLERWEATEMNEGAGLDDLVAAVVADKFTSDMKKVMAGASMVAKMAEGIEKELVKGKTVSGFVLAARTAIRDNIYYKMTDEGLCKFGNDYAIGLRWLRHLGYVQVSTNPVLAARAYEDDPALWSSLKQVARSDRFSAQHSTDDDVAMEATMVALWPNLAVLRPIAILSGMHDGMVSYQLSPLVAGSLEGSFRDGMKIYSAAQEFLRRYDAYLMWGYCNADERGRPNIVFKVAAETAAAIDITRSLNEMGIGTNNTVTFAVAQETALIMAAIEGMVRAKSMGIHVTQVYETNMGGRLESHLREVEAAKLLHGVLGATQDKRGFLEDLASRVGARQEADGLAPIDDKVKVICSVKHLAKLTDQPFAEALTAGRSVDDSGRTLSMLAELEDAIEYAGTLVAQRVYDIFFSPENRVKWLAHIRKEFGLSEREAEEIMDRIDVLPASKRRPNDTYFTLARNNMTNTEFPNHQFNVLSASQQDGFDVHEFDGAITKNHNPEALAGLLSIEDFRRAYETTPELAVILEKVGIEGQFGGAGLKPDEWSSFGPVVKTMTEFRNAYERFKKQAVEFVRRATIHPKQRRAKAHERRS